MNAVKKPVELISIAIKPIQIRARKFVKNLWQKWQVL
jgi:hypothetical protein